MFGAGVMWLYHSAAVSDIEADVAKGLQKQAEQLQMVAAKAQKEVSKIEQYHHDKLTASIAALPEPKRVFVRAACVPETGVPGVGEEQRAELDASGRSTLRRLREGILRLEAKLAFYQDATKAQR
jgi:hypothetical protein